MRLAHCDEWRQHTLSHALELQEWHDLAYELADRQLRSAFIVGNLSEGIGWIHDAQTFNYSAAACIAEHGCSIDRDFSTPEGDGLLTVTPLSDFAYTGDYNATDPPPAGAVPYSIAAELKCKSDAVAAAACSLQCRSSRNIAAGVECRGAALPAADAMRWLLDADELYLTPALLALSAIYEDEALHQIDVFLSFLSIFVPTFCVLFTIGILVFFIPQVNRTNTDIQTKRSMLLYLPAQVVSRNKSIKELIEGIVAQEQFAAQLASRRQSR